MKGQGGGKRQQDGESAAPFSLVPKVLALLSLDDGGAPCNNVLLWKRICQSITVLFKSQYKSRIESLLTVVITVSCLKYCERDFSKIDHSSLTTSQIYTQAASSSFLSLATLE